MVHRLRGALSDKAAFRHAEFQYYYAVSRVSALLEGKGDSSVLEVILLVAK